LYVVGLMSGTSADGIDAALVDIKMESDLQMELIAFEHTPYPEKLRRELQGIMSPGQGTIDELAYLHYFLGQKFGEAALRVIEGSGLERSQVELVCSHGHTVRNLPPREGYFPSRCRMQLGEIAVIAEITGITTVGDFRPAEVAAGGEGAPLISNFDYHMFTSPESSRIVLNIGGISNVTYLPAGASLEDVRAFDVGPGNMIIDEVVWRLTDGAQSFDQDGQMAAAGVTHAGLLAELMDHPFIKHSPPKSAGREEFGQQFVDQVMARSEALGVAGQDLVATVTEFTAEAIALNCRTHFQRIDELIAGGGGAYNRTLMGMLQSKLGGAKVSTTEDYGVPIDAKEAMGFAFLGYQTLHRRPNNVPKATGARHPVIMGKVAWAPPKEI